MILFQQIALPILGLLIAWELYGRLRGRDSGLANLLRLGLWGAALIAITWPNMLTTIAGTIGIRRGADLVLYLFALAFLGTSFYFYSRSVRLERQLAQVVRHLAIQDAQRGALPDGEGNASPSASQTTRTS
jgi:hypothetical protein